MRYRVLGPMEVDGATATVTPRAAKLRVVLATLLLQTNKVVSVETLIDELWAERPPRTAMTTLQVYISQLRKLFDEADPEQGRDLLATKAPGYLLHVEPEQLDLRVFQDLYARGQSAARENDHAQAAALHRQALKLWRGPLLPDIPHGALLEASAVRADELHLGALEQRIRADLRLGQHHALISELRGLIAEFPLNEELRAHQMVALYRSGRQADALQTFNHLRRTVVEELGIEPGAPLRRVHQRILAGDPTLFRPGGSVAAVTTLRSEGPAPESQGRVHLPPATPEFVGRADALEQAGTALRQAAAGKALPAVVSVHGRPGVGKTAFVVHLAHQLGELFPGGRIHLDLQPAGGPMSRAASLGAFLRRCGRTGALPTDEEQLAEQVHHLLNERRMLVVLDNVADEAGIRPFLPATPGSVVLAAGRRPLAGLGAVPLRLDVLPAPEARQLLVAAAGPGRVDAASPECAEIVEHCGYLPVAIRIAGARLAATPHWDAAELAERLRDRRHRLGELRIGDLDVRACLLIAYQDEAEPVRRAFRLLALLPSREFDLWLAAETLGVDQREAARLVERLVDTHLLEADGLGPTARFRYHGLLQALALDLLASHETAQERLSATERIGLACLALSDQADRRLWPGRAATTTQPAGTPAQAQPLGGDPLHWFAEEHESLGRVVELLHTSELWDLTWRLAGSLAGYLEAVAAWELWDATERIALDAASRLADPVREAACLNSLGDLAWQRQDHAEAAHLYRRAQRLTELPPDAPGEPGASRQRIRALVGLADVELLTGDPAAARSLAAGALELAGLADDSWGACHALRALAVTALEERQPQRALRYYEECGRVAHHLRNRRFEGYTVAAARRIRSGELTDASGDTELRPGTWRLMLAPALRRAG